MGRVLTNSVSFQYALEDTETSGSAGIGVLPGSPVWKGVEPNNISQFGSTISTIARSPISAQRGRRKGITSDLESGVAFDADITYDAMLDFAEGFVFAKSTMFDLLFARAPATGSGYTIPAATAAQAAKLIFGTNLGTTLVYASGYATAANNGLKPLTADVAAAGVLITVAGNVAEASPPAGAMVQIAGIRGETADLALTVSGITATLVSTDAIFLNAGLKPGQLIHIGGLTGANQFSAGKGFARIVSINTSGTTLTLDKLSSTLATDPGTGETIDILFGQFIRDVPVTSAEFLQRSLQFEGAFPGLGPANETEYEYALGNFCNELALTMEVADKAVFTAGLIGTTSETPTTVRKTNAATGKLPNITGAFGTSSDFARVRIQNVDGTGLTTDFKSMTLTISNNVSPEKVLGFLGARFMNYGNFFVNLEAQALFTNLQVIDRIRNNTTVTLDFILQNDDGSTISVDVPSTTLGDGSREYPLNETVLINLTGEAFQDPLLGTSIGISTIPVTPA